MAELHVLIPRRGSPFAPELDRRLAGNEPLSSVVDWWHTEYHEWRKLQVRAASGGPTKADLTENEDAVYSLGRAWWFAPPDEEGLTEATKDPDVQVAWGPVRQARAALRAQRASHS